MSSETNDERVFSIGQAADFFDQGVSWLRWQERRNGIFVDASGKPIEVKRSETQQGPGFRQYTLQNIEDLAQSLFRHEKITKDELDTVLKRVEAFRS